tara:strand:- start:807 stop:935 length:129 start_codon:yes stop_codon:yes gene_type:complete
MAKLRRMVSEVTYIWYEAELTDEQAKHTKKVMMMFNGISLKM